MASPTASTIYIQDAEAVEIREYVQGIAVSDVNLARCLLVLSSRAVKTASSLPNQFFSSFILFYDQIPVRNLEVTLNKGS